MAPKTEMQPCPICLADTAGFGEMLGKITNTVYRFRRCPACDFVFVENPASDYAAIYDEAYYRGEGADPLVDYAFELDHPLDTIRLYEWRGIVRAVQTMRGESGAARWLDFGAGAGGLVRLLNEQPGIVATGYDEGAFVARARNAGIPFVTAAELETEQSRFDVVTMIEVVEHIPDPVRVLKQVRDLLKPGGILFLTTGNSEPHLARFQEWGYVRPEIHLSYFTPRSLAFALGRAGFDARFPGPVAGWTDIIRFKILKNLRVRRRGMIERALPWAMLARLANSRLGIASHPIGVVPAYKNG